MADKNLLIVNFDGVLGDVFRPSVVDSESRTAIYFNQGRPVFIKELQEYRLG